MLWDSKSNQRGIAGNLQCTLKRVVRAMKVGEWALPLLLPFCCSLREVPPPIRSLFWPFPSCWFWFFLCSQPPSLEFILLYLALLLSLLTFFPFLMLAILMGSACSKELNFDGSWVLSLCWPFSYLIVDCQLLVIATTQRVLDCNPICTYMELNPIGLNRTFFRTHAQRIVLLSLWPMSSY